MTIAIWIIAVCSMVRIIQNGIQLNMLLQERGARENAYSEFIKSLKQSDKEFGERLLDEWRRQEEDERLNKEV